MSQLNENITANLKKIISGSITNIPQYYCREDFEYMIKRINNPKEKSGAPSKKKVLREMCIAYEISIELLLDKATIKDELGKIPTRKELKKILLLEMYSVYKAFPASENYIERIVNQRLGDKFSGDPLRVRILKHMIGVTDYYTKPIIKRIERTFSADEKKQYKKLKGNDARVFIINKIDDSLFRFGESYLGNIKLIKYLNKKLHVEKLGKEGFVVSGQLEERFISIKKFSPELEKNEINPQDISEFIKVFLDCKQINWLEFEQSTEVMHTVTQLEKEYREHLKPISYTTSKGKIASLMEKYDAAKDNVISDNNFLLKLSNSLANGAFYTNGATKSYLYPFAVAFDLMYYFDHESGDYDASRDLEKNLFYDFYGDNYLRYVSNKTFLEDKSSQEKEPTSEGINFKNFVEAIYIYYITRRDFALTSSEKLKRIHQMIDACKKRHQALKKMPKKSMPKETILYKNNLQSNILMLSEEAFIDYIASNYDFKDNREKSDFLAASNQFTAEKYLHTLMEKIRVYRNELPDQLATDLQNLLSYFENQANNDARIKNMLNDKSFSSLLEKIDQKLNTIHEMKDITKIEASRTNLILLYVCVFIYENVDLKNDLEIKEMNKFYKRFVSGDDTGERITSNGINKILEECRYQKIYEKNILDMYVIFSLYLWYVDSQIDVY
ncbi:hypothetical protein KHM83_16490 [Fusibacter paucivorans]|uniref:EF-hand domain-containing protein n=1 Tax=Fusibacter paucivorans TaxID=76009 RepID=A0ABS5PV09_9FIRM|nr:hypothetical protein [Fusibacter paucivorans]MBS7528289.1 hypothetical protein [Fusibacter paucivorans]